MRNWSNGQRLAALLLLVALATVLCVIVGTKTNQWLAPDGMEWKRRPVVGRECVPAGGSSGYYCEKED